jgi:hypothetical protein
MDRDDQLATYCSTQTPVFSMKRNPQRHKAPVFFST